MCKIVFASQKLAVEGANKEKSFVEWDKTRVIRVFFVALQLDETTKKDCVNERTCHATTLLA